MPNNMFGAVAKSKYKSGGRKYVANRAASSSSAKRTYRRKGKYSLFNKRKSRPIVPNMRGRSTQGGVLKRVGLLIDPFDFHQYTQPRLLPAPPFLAHFICRGSFAKNSNGSIQPGCGTSFLVVTPHTSWAKTVSGELITNTNKFLWTFF